MGFTILDLAKVMVRIKFCISVVNILFLASNASYKCGASTKSLFRALIILLMVSASLFICFCVSEFMAIYLEFDSTSLASVNLILKKSVASGVPATTFRAVPNKSKLLAILW